MGEVFKPQRVEFTGLSRLLTQYEHKKRILQLISKSLCPRESGLVETHFAW